MVTYNSDTLIKYFSTTSKIICAIFFICRYLFVQDDKLCIMNIIIPYPYFAGFISGMLITTWVTTTTLQIFDSIS